MTERFPVENGLRFLAAISHQHLRDFIELVYVHMGPAHEPQLLVYSDETPAEGIFLSFHHMMHASKKQSNYIDAMYDRGEL